MWIKFDNNSRLVQELYCSDITEPPTAPLCEVLKVTTSWVNLSVLRDTKWNIGLIFVSFLSIPDEPLRVKQ